MSIIFYILIVGSTIGNKYKWSLNSETMTVADCGAVFPLKRQPQSATVTVPLFKPHLYLFPIVEPMIKI